MTGLNNIVPNNDDYGIYGAYRNETDFSVESDLRPETQRYIDQSIIPVVKLNPSMLSGMRNYLNSQGIFDPAAVSYIESQIK